MCPLFFLRLLQLLRRSCHTGAATRALAPWPSTVRLWVKRSPWATALDLPRGELLRSRTAWYSAAVHWRSRRGSVWSWAVKQPNGMELCAWASPMCTLQPDRFLCPQWPSPTSLRNLGTGLHLCPNTSRKQVRGWSSGCRKEAPCTSKAATASHTSCSQEWISASHCGPWLTSMHRPNPSCS